MAIRELELWFDVGNERYTTVFSLDNDTQALWFDVGNERYTTETSLCNFSFSCGLM